VQEAKLAKVSGIGSFFFRARDPKALAPWYEFHLGVDDIVSTVCGGKDVNKKSAVVKISNSCARRSEKSYWDRISRSG